MSDPNKRDPEPPTVPYSPPPPSPPASNGSGASEGPPSSGEQIRDLVRQVVNADALAGQMAEDEEGQILRDWLQLQPDGVLGTGDRRFKIGKQIGCGGMGVVYGASWQGTTRGAAVKVVFRVKKGADGLSRLLEEVKITENLESDYVPRIHAHGLEPDFAWFAMDYFEGGTLYQHIRNVAPLTWEQTKKICQDILKALRDAHASGLTHGDLKPGNVMAIKDGSKWVVLDWGLARAVSPASGAAVTDCISGTLKYLAPECWKNRAEYSAKSDFYALGVMMVEMLTPNNPFAGVPDLQLEAAHQNAKLGEVPGLPEEARGIVARATDVEPGARYRNADEFLADLDARRGGSLRKPRMWLRLAFAGLVMLALALGLLFFRPSAPPRFQGDLTLWLAGRNEQLFPEARPVGAANTLPLRSGDQIVLQAKLEQGPAAHFYVIWIDSEGKSQRRYPDGWSASELPSLDEKRQDLRWPANGEAAKLAKSTDGFESILWLVREKPLNRRDNAQLKDLLDALAWRQPPEWKGKEIAVWWEDGLRDKKRGAPELTAIRVADDPIAQTEKLLRTLKERGLASYSRAVCYSFVGQEVARRE